MIVQQQPLNTEMVDNMSNCSRKDSMINNQNEKVLFWGEFDLDALLTKLTEIQSHVDDIFPPTDKLQLLEYRESEKLDNILQYKEKFDYYLSAPQQTTQ